MPHKYKPYPEYKDSGIEWLGDMPKGWSAIPVGRVYNRIKRTGYQSKELLSVYRDHGVVPKSSRDDNNNKPSDDLSPYQLVKINDLVMNKMKTWQGSIAVSKYEGIVSPAYYVYAPTKKLFNVAYSEYIHFLMRTPMYIAQYLRYSKGIRVNQWDLEPEQFKLIELILPSKDEQYSIAAFLDHETGKIDELIEKQQKLIELLEEKRQAVISQAVTKGFDSNAPMKDSGIEWLGNIPEHWSVKRIKHFGRVLGGYAFKSEDFSTEGVQVIKISNVSHLQFNWKDSSFIHERCLDTQKEYIPPKGSLLFAMTRPIISGGVKVVKLDNNNKYLVNQRVGFLKPTSLISQDFLMYVAQSRSFFCMFENNITMTNQPNISSEGIEDISFGCPDLLEQETIAKHIKQTSDKFNKLISKAKSAIDLMRERRTALISAAVTGKIDVRDFKMATEQKNIKANVHFKRSVLAAEIAERMQHQNKFGRIKFQKILVLCDLHLDMDIGGKYQRDAAGPFDNKMMRSITSQLEKQKWFKPVKPKDGYGTKYEPMEKAGGHQEYFYKYWGDKLDRFNELLALLEPMTTEQAEIVATLYSAWHDFLEQGEQPTDEELVTEVRTNWHESKERIEPARWHKAINWMRQKRLVPHSVA